MATSSIPTKARTLASGRATTANPAMIALEAVASLKLTVALFGMSIFLIFYGTLAQAEKDMWLVLRDYFTSWGAIIELRYFFPKPWFPASEFPKLQNISGWFPFPGGAMIGLVMVTNLLSAHLIRFKLQARGARLAAGLAIAGLGVVITGIIIVSGHNQVGLQGKPPFSWDTFWVLIKVAMVGLWVAAAVGQGILTVRARFSRIEYWGLLGALALLTALDAWLLISGFRMSDSALRILWQLTQGLLAGLILLGGFLLAFKKRAGIVLIHCGVGLIMLGQLLVAKYDVEEQMQLEEGQTVSFARDIRGVELAVVDSSSPAENRVVAIPLAEKGAPTAFLAESELIRDERLPFDVQILRYVKNSELVNGAPANNPATRGLGLAAQIRPLRPGSGTDTDAASDSAAAYVRFTDREGSRDLGTFLVSQEMEFSGQPELVRAAGKTYEIYLRFKRAYMPYSFQLVDVRKDDYLGTDTPRNYSSELVLTDPESGTDRNVLIWMNNPLRYRGKTFYQTGYQKYGKRVTDPATGQQVVKPVELTTIAVVTNNGWMIPYVACMLVAVGMTSHFGGTLTRFLRRRADERARLESASAGEPVMADVVGGRPERRGKAPRSNPPGAQPLPSSSAEWPVYVVPLAAVVVALGAIGYSLVPGSDGEDQMQIVAFGRLPVTYEGRTKPMDSVARNALRVISNRETWTNENDETEPAIKWLLDVISHSDDAYRHRVFRIDNLDVLHTLGLQRRKHFRYAFEEFEPRMPEFRRQVAQARDTAKDQLTLYQRKLLELDRRVQLFFQFSECFRIPAADLPTAFEETNQLIGLAELVRQLDGAPVPYAVPTGEADEPWRSLAVVATRDWVKQLAKKGEYTDVRDMARGLAREVFANEQFVDRLVTSRVMRIVEDFVRQNSPSLTEQEVRDRAAQQYGQMPADIRDGFEKRTREEILSEGATIEANVAQAIAATLGDESLSDPANPAARELASLLLAYREQRIDQFNDGIRRYRDRLKTDRPSGYTAARIGFESYFNGANPFVFGRILYVAAFILTAAAWLGWSVPLNRAAFWMLVVILLFHTAALIGRIYISGRPPVTNLYSSAVFIGWAGVLFSLILECVYRLGIGNTIASAAGFLTLFVAHGLNTEVPSHQGDTYTVLQAVLDTQFWLATHVVCITLGYATTYVAGLLGIMYVIRGVFTNSLTAEVKRVLTRCIYGIVCFSLLFSFIGTILGGLWADDSWGRFWGWDPKENGALIIVLWNALILHARWGTMIKDRGLAVLAIFGNVVTSWSWFGVNELNVGLHSYGFTEGVLLILALVVASQLTLMAIGLLPRSWWVSKA